MHYEEQNRDKTNIIQAAIHISPLDCQVSAQFQLSRDPSAYNPAINCLRELTTYKTIHEKLRCLSDTCQLIQECVDEYVDTFKENYMAVTSEDILPIFVYIICRAQIPDVIYELNFVKGFLPGPFSNAIEGFAVATFEASVSILNILKVVGGFKRETKPNDNKTRAFTNAKPKNSEPPSINNNRQENIVLEQRPRQESRWESGFFPQTRQLITSNENYNQPDEPSNVNQQSSNISQNGHTVVSLQSQQPYTAENNVQLSLQPDFRDLRSNSISENAPRRILFQRRPQEKIESPSTNYEKSPFG